MHPTATAGGSQDARERHATGRAIRPSSSPWCNAVILVRKKDGGLRFCIDFRKLNARTKKDSYPLPRIQETLESLEGSCIFSSFDFKSGFWQVEMDEASKQYTAFTVGSLGFFECERMPGTKPMLLGDLM